MTTLAELIQQGFRSVAIDVTGVVIDANSKFAQKADLDSVSVKVANLEANKLDKSANVSSATKATQDGDGNVISKSYLKLSGGTVTGKTSFTSPTTTVNKVISFTDTNNPYIEMSSGSTKWYIQSYEGNFGFGPT